MLLHQELLTLRKKEKQIAHQIIEKLQLMEEGRKYLKLGYSSLFDYLVRGLGYSESAAYRRQSCVRLSQELPEITDKIQSGALTTAGLGMAFKSLKGKPTTEKRVLLARIENKPTREIRRILTQEEIAPQVKIQKSEFKDKVILRLELSHEQNIKLEKLRTFKSHCGNLEQLLEDLIDRDLRKYENSKFKPSKSKNPRFVSQTLKNHLLQKAKYKCQHPGCEETHYLQIDHIKPVCHGGLANKENLQVLCGPHNRLKG